MALEDFARLALFVNGVPQRKLTSVDHKTESGQIVVHLMNEGLGGWTPGSGMCRMSIGYSIPLSGVEFNWQAAAVAGDLIKLQLAQGPDTYVGTGKVIDAGVNQTVNASTEGTVEWEGEFKPFQ